MADNFSVTEGSGKTIRSDDVGGVQHQIIKIDGGGDGVSIPIVAGQQLAANSLPVTLTELEQDLIGELDETAPASDTASSGLNGRLQRIAQNLTSYLGVNSGAKVITDANGTIQQYLRGLIYLAITALKVGGNTIVQAASSTITRPADTTAYASGDLVANSTTAGSVNNLQFTTAARVSGGSGVIVGAEIQKSTPSVTNAAFRLHLFDTAPTYTSAGDNSAISSVVQASGKGYLGYIDIPAMIAFQDVAWGSGAPDNARGAIPFVASAQTIYGLLEVRGAYTPGSSEVFTVKINAYQD